MAAGETSARPRPLRLLWITLGPLLALGAGLSLPASYAGPDGATVALGSGARVTAGLAVWMATWWMSEAIPLYATALLPLAVLPLSSARSPADAAAPYAHPLIFLFLGGFVIALAMQRWGLDRRVALAVLQRVGTRPRAIVAGFMALTAGMSMWVSNTATAVMMLPIATSVIALVAGEHGASSAGDREEPGGVGWAFPRALLLGIAYSASIGGVGTLIGTPPNLFLASFLERELGVEISFVRWMAIGVPFVLLFLPLTWWLLTRVLFPLRATKLPGGEGLYRAAARELGPMKRAEWITAAVFSMAAAAWVSRPWLVGLTIAGHRPLAGLSDPGIAIGAALLLFVLPVGGEDRASVMDWATAERVPFGLLLLFGGGLSLADALQRHGVGVFLGTRVHALAGLPELVLVAVVVGLMIFLTEVTSNTATTASLVPILAGIAPGLELDPLTLVVPAVLAASCAFMLPVATPPNAVVFGSGRLEAGDMLRAGLWLNLIGIVLITTLAMTWMRHGLPPAG